MDRFRDRIDAGKRLGAALLRYQGQGALVLGIPRGGATVAYEVAKALDAEFSILVVRKLPFPDNPEAGFGAIAEDGATFFMPHARAGLPLQVVTRTLRQQEAEVVRRVNALRGGQPLANLRGRHTILVDDGIAMGSTTQAAVLCCRRQGAARVTVAAPVASPNACAALSESADELVVLLTPRVFQAVAEFYDEWYDVPDREVVAVVAAAAAAGKLAPPAAPGDAPGTGRAATRAAERG